MAFATVKDVRARMQAILDGYCDSVGAGNEDINRRLSNGLLTTLFSPKPDGRFDAKIALVEKCADKAIADIEEARSAGVRELPDEKQELDILAIAYVSHLLLEEDEIYRIISFLIEDDPPVRNKAFRAFMFRITRRREKYANSLGYAFNKDTGDVVINNDFSNNISGSTVMGSVQQGTTNSTINDSSFKNVEDIKSSIDSAQAELASLDASSEKYAILLELERMKNQLKSAEPSPSFLATCASSIRSICENVAGGVLTPGALQAVQRLLTYFPA